MGPDTARTAFVKPELGLPGCFSQPDLMLSLPIWLIDIFNRLRQSLTP